MKRVPVVPYESTGRGETNAIVSTVAGAGAMEVGRWAIPWARLSIPGPIFDPTGPPVGPPIKVGHCHGF